MFTNNKFKQLDAVAEMIKGIADADAKNKMDEMRGIINDTIIAGHNNMKVPVAKGLEEYSFLNESDTSVKIDTPTGTRVLGHRYGNAAKTHRDSMSDPFAVVRGPNKKDIEALEKKKVKKEAVDPTDTTTDTLSGRVKGGAPNQHSSFKVKLKAEEMEKEELVGKQHKLDKNKNGKLDSQDFKMLRKEELEELMEYGPSATAALRQGQQPIQVAAADRKDQENTLNIKRSAMKAQQDVAKGLDPTQTAAGQRMAEGWKQTLRKFDPTIKARIRGKSQDQTNQGLDTIQHLADLGLKSDDMVSRAMKPNTYFKNAERYAKLANKGVAEGSFSDMDVQKKDKQYAGTQAYNAKKKVEKEKTAGAAKTTFRAKFGLVKKEEDEELDEASYINGKETSNEPKWKMTGLSHGDAIKKHGEDRVKKVQSRNRSGDLTGGHHVEVLMKEGIGLDEAKSNYELYHPTYSGAIHHALAHHASKAGLSVSDDDYHHHVSIGPRKPTEGVSVSHSLPASDENGGKHMVHMQIYNRGGDKKPFELNTYSSKIAKTSGRTMKEDTQLDERELSPAEKDAVEVNVMSMKKNLAGFKARYGKDAKSVMYATATKQAKKD